MSRSVNESTERVTRLLAGLDGGPEADGTPPGVAEALDHASDPATPTEDAARIDEAAIFVLKSAADVDSLLAELALERIAGLAERTAARLDGASEPPDEGRRQAAWDVLDLLRRPALLRRIEPDDRNAWADRMLALIDASHFTVGPLLRQRAELYGSRVLFELPAGRRRHLSWRRVASRVEFLGRVLLALRREHDDETPVAILSEPPPVATRWVDSRIRLHAFHS